MRPRSLPCMIGIRAAMGTSKQESDVISFMFQEDHFSYDVRLTGKKRGQEALLGAYPDSSARWENRSEN